ncbi:L-arabinose transport system permease protein AraP [Anaerolineae bacterium]|nr:L-arabinose transport system permease protein AraP [Anaerolineae bacterium]
MTTSTATSANIGPESRLTILQRQRRWGWVFLSPWIFGFFVFTFFPMIASFVFSFTNFRIGEPIQLLSDNPDCVAEFGSLRCLFGNWEKMFTDPVTSNALGVTLRFMLIAAPISILFPLGMASLLNSKFLLGKPILRVLFYMPFMVPAISGVFIWQSYLNGQTGYLNRILRLLGITEPPNWLFDSAYMHTAFVLIGLWGVGNAMLTMLASMQGVPTELYEAARVDGATGPVVFWKITLPMISPVILYNLVLSLVGLMQYFIVPYVMSNTTRSDPSANFINLHLYRTGFAFGDMGFASAQAWLIFIVALAFTVGIFATSRRWVYYASGG